MQDCDSSIIGFSVEGALLILIMWRLSERQNRNQPFEVGSGELAVLILSQVKQWLVNASLDISGVSLSRGLKYESVRTRNTILTFG